MVTRKYYVIQAYDIQYPTTCFRVHTCETESLTHFIKLVLKSLSNIKRQLTPCL